MSNISNETDKADEKETISGELGRIVYQNDNNFIIGAFQGLTTRVSFTAIGTIINPQVNMDYSLTGTWETNVRYGDQFKFDRYETIKPRNANGIFKYIVRQCKFVGSTVGSRLVEAYGKDTLEMMKDNPEQIAADIQGITLARAQEVQKTLIENEMNETVMIELENMLDVPGMRKSLLGDLIASYKNNAGDVLRKNPYIITIFSGIGFAMADRVALNIGFPRDSPARKRAATVHVLQEVMNEGSIWIERTELIERVKELIQIKNLAEGLELLLADKDVVQNSDGLVAFRYLAENEQQVAEMLVEMEMMI